MKLREETGESITEDCEVSVSYSFDGTEFNGENWLVSNGYFTKVLTDAKDKSFLWMKYDLVLKGFLKVSDSIRLNIEDLDTIYLHEFSPKIIHLERIKKGLDIGKYYKVGMIYFDVNKFNIRPDAAIELNKIIKALNENPEISIELGSHTDCRGSSKSNQILSQKRAKSSAEYIMSKGGIASERLSYKGYGESQIINGCVDGVTCSDEEHAVNRRTEFKITDTEIN
jgi:flagellar motor protein MotB